MFISVQDELMELVKEIGVIEEQSPPPATYEPTIPPVTLTTSKHHKHDELLET